MLIEATLLLYSARCVFEAKLPPSPVRHFFAARLPLGSADVDGSLESTLLLLRGVFIPPAIRFGREAKFLWFWMDERAAANLKADANAPTPL